MIELIKPLGHIATIVAFNEDQDLNALKLKSITFTHEFMFARPIHRTPDMIKQHEYLEDITKNIESGHYQPTTTQVFEGLSPENLYQAHQLLEKQSMIGKLVINIYSLVSKVALCRKYCIGRLILCLATIDSKGKYGNFAGINSIMH